MNTTGRPTVSDHERAAFSEEEFQQVKANAIS
jgi:hypothetical protein